MIRKNSLLCKLNQLKCSSKSIFDDMMSSFHPDRETCPHCKSSGNCVFHKTYERYLVDYYHGRIESHIICITVVQCTSCGGYHSILPDIIIPYLSHSLIFVLTVLDQYFSRRNTIQGICDRFGIDPPTLYRWKKKFLEHKRLWLGALETQLQSASGFLDGILARQSFSAFNDSFIQSFVVSFLQSHPPHSRRRKSR